MVGTNKGPFDILGILVFRTMGTRCDNAADAAFLVNVIATVSVGSNPGQSSSEVLSLDGHLITPIPCNGIRGADGNILVAL